MTMITERLKLLIDDLGINKREFSRRLKISESTVSNIFSGKATPSSVTIKKICEEFTVNAEWLENGVGEMYVDMDDIERTEGKLRKLMAEYRLSSRAAKQRKNLIDLVLDMDDQTVETLYSICSKVCGGKTAADREADIDVPDSDSGY